MSLPVHPAAHNVLQLQQLSGGAPRALTATREKKSSCRQVVDEARPAHACSSCTSSPLIVPPPNKRSYTHTYVALVYAVDAIDVINDEQHIFSTAACMTRQPVMVAYITYLIFTHGRCHKYNVQNSLRFSSHSEYDAIQLVDNTFMWARTAVVHGSGVA